MQVSSRLIHLTDLIGQVEPKELDIKFVRVGGLNPGFRSCCKELLQSGVPK
jgi:hypothetical protein